MLQFYRWIFVHNSTKLGKFFLETVLNFFIGINFVQPKIERYMNWFKVSGFRFRFFGASTIIQYTVSNRARYRKNRNSRGSTKTKRTFLPNDRVARNWSV